MGKIEVGSAVAPINGRFADRPMAVVALCGEYAMVCDGKRRRLGKPKKKKLCHLSLLSEDAARLTVDAELTDGALRRFLRTFREPERIPDNKHDSKI